MPCHPISIRFISPKNHVRAPWELKEYFVQVNPMSSLRELHIKSLKVRSLTMANFLLDSFPSLEKTSSWMLDMNQEDTRAFRARVKEYRERGIKIEYKEW